MSETIIQAMQKRLASILSRAIERTAASYENYLENGMKAEDCAAFSKQHMAGKIAAAHLAVVFKLFELIHGKAQGEGAAEGLSAHARYLVEQANIRMDVYERNPLILEGEDDDRD